MPLTFGQPEALGLLLGLPIFYLVGRGRLARLPVSVRRAALAARLAIVAALVLALARPSLLRPYEDLAVVFALDASASVSPEVRAAAERWIGQALEAARPGDRAAVVVFGADAGVQTSFGEPPAPGKLRPLEDGTNVAQALHLADAILPSSGGRRIVLLSDGNETAGSAVGEAQYLAQRGVQVSIVPLAAADGLREVLIESVDAPAYVRQGESFDVAVGISSTYATPATLEVAVGDRTVTESAVDLRAGANRFAVRLTAAAPGFQAYRARVTAPGDTHHENDEGWGYTVVKAAGRVLAIARDAAAAAPLRQALESAGMVVEVQPPSFVPSSLPPLAGYDGFALVNVPATSFTFDQMKTLTALVRSRGRGLVVVGGDASLSLGGYQDTPLADSLPVALVVPGGSERGDVGLVLVIDRSGSMGMLEDGTQKVAMARESAQRAAMLLETGDTLGVVAFDTESRVVVPPQRVGNQANRLQIRGLIAGIEASGGTDIRQALQTAVNLTLGIGARYRHIILLSDGRPNNDTPFDDLVKRMQAARITLSTIAIGSDADTALMQQLARQGQGRYYYAEKARDLPTITMREAQIATGAASATGPFRPRLPAAGDPSPLLRSFSEADLPALSGYVVTTPRDGAQIALTSGREDPVLAHWHYGLGRVVVWTSDVTTGWAADWLRWPRFGQFWSQAVRWSLPSPASPNLQVSSVVHGRQVTVRVDVTDDDGALQNFADVRARVRTAAGQSDELRLYQVRPGQYSTAFDAPGEGAYELDVARLQGETTLAAETAGFVVPYAAEYRRFGVDLTPLRQVAATTAGRALREPAEAFGRDLTFAGQDRVPLWPLLLTVAVALVPVDVGIRRLKLSPAYLRWRLWLPVLAATRGARLAPGRALDFARRHWPR